MANIIYKPTPTGKKFHLARNIDTAFIRGLLGPFGSGKSVACVMELMMIAMAQEPDRDSNIRRTRFAVVRNTYRELLDTTLATFFAWVDKETGHFSSLNMVFKLEQELPDGTVMLTEFLFRALDKPDDVKKLLSLEITAAWINEAREVPFAVLNMIQGRCGRYPATFIHQEPTFFGVIMDTNPPDSDHWWYKIFEEKIPDNHKLFKQPSGLSPKAENIPNLPRNYYKNLMQGKTLEWISVYIHANYGFLADGRPVFNEYKDDVHFMDIDYVPNEKLTIYIGIDFGLTPSAVFGQLTATGKMVVFDELVTFDMGAMSFGKLLKEKCNTKYSKFTFEVYADPAGEHRAETDEQTPFMILSNQGIDAYPTYTNDFTIRREAVADYMQRLDFNGKPAFGITRGAVTLRKALSGGYAYKRVQVTGEDRFTDKPNKNKFSHVADACQYLFLGAVGGSRVVGGFSNKALDYSNVNRGIV